MLLYNAHFITFVAFNIQKRLIHHYVSELEKYNTVEYSVKRDVINLWFYCVLAVNFSMPMVN